jgi:hypothetical protein
MIEEWRALRSREGRLCLTNLEGMAGLYFGGWLPVFPTIPV